MGYKEVHLAFLLPSDFLPAPPISQTQTEARGKRAQWIQSILHQPDIAQSGEEWSVNLWRLNEYAVQ